MVRHHDDLYFTPTLTDEERAFPQRSTTTTGVRRWPFTKHEHNRGEGDG